MTIVYAIADGRRTRREWKNQHLEYTPTKAVSVDLIKLLKEVGVAIDKEELDSMMKALNGKKLHDLVREGTPKLASVSVGGKENLTF